MTPRITVKQNTMAQQAGSSPEACPWCSARSTVCTAERAAHGYGMQMSIWQCQACDCLFCPESDRVDVDYGEIRAHHAWYRLASCAADHVARLLREGPERFWANEAVRFLEQFRRDSDRRFDEVLRRLTRASADDQRLRFIEVGFGWGAVCGIAAHLGHKVIGYDIDGLWIDEARERFRESTAEFIGVTSDWFEPNRHQTPEPADLVFCGEVIEHSPDPRGLLKRLCEIVAPGGTLVLTTPAVVDGRWAGDPPPVHQILIPGNTLADTLRTDLGSEWTVSWWREVIGTPTRAPHREGSSRRDPARRCVDPTAKDYYAKAPNHTRIISARVLDSAKPQTESPGGSADVSVYQKPGGASIVTATRHSQDAK